MYAGVGDIIKFGRVRFRIRRLVLGNDNETEENTDYYGMGGEDWSAPVHDDDNDLVVHNNR